MSNTNIDGLTDLIERCLAETNRAAQNKYGPENAERTAAMFLEAQMRLSLYLEDLELRSRMAKNDIERIEAEKYFEYKMSGGEKKVTENALINMVAKDKDVYKAREESAKLEAELKKWGFIMSSLKDSHIYFRNIGKV